MMRHPMPDHPVPHHMVDPVMHHVMMHHPMMHHAMTHHMMMHHMVRRLRRQRPPGGGEEQRQGQPQDGGKRSAEQGHGEVTPKLRSGKAQAPGRTFHPIADLTYAKLRRAGASPPPPASARLRRRPYSRQPEPEDPP